MRSYRLTYHNDVLNIKSINNAIMWKVVEVEEDEDKFAQFKWNYTKAWMKYREAWDENDVDVVAVAVDDDDIDAGDVDWKMNEKKLWWKW